MSELTLFKSGDALPDYLRSEPDELTKRLAGNTGGKSISTEGGVFRMIVGGDEIAKNEERGMNVVIVNAARDVARAFYVGEYVKGESSGPLCASGDGKTPDVNSKEIQSSSCASCKQNIAGSGKGDSRACRFNQRIAVVLENDIGGNVYRLQLPATSIFGKADGDKMPLKAYATFLAGHGVPISGVVTEARFDTSASVAVLKFRASRPLTPAELVVARSQAATEDARQAVEFKLAPPKDAPSLPLTFAQSAKSEATANSNATDVEVKEPTKRPTKKTEAAAAPKDMTAVLDDWGSDDE